MCSKVFFLNPRRTGKSRRICICVPACPSEDINVVKQLTAYYVRHDVKFCRYDILVDKYRDQYNKDRKTSIDDVTCPDLPRTKGYLPFKVTADIIFMTVSVCQFGLKTNVQWARNNRARPQHCMAGRGYKLACGFRSNSGILKCINIIMRPSHYALCIARLHPVFLSVRSSVCPTRIAAPNSRTKSDRNLKLTRTS